METENDIDEAIKFYEKAKDLASVVRIFCQTKSQAKALEFVRSTKNHSAAFQLAHTMEFDETYDPDILIELFELAGAYGNAIRICIVSFPDFKC